VAYQDLFSLETNVFLGLFTNNRQVAVILVNVVFVRDGLDLLSSLVLLHLSVNQEGTNSDGSSSNTSGDDTNSASGVIGSGIAISSEVVVLDRRSEAGIHNGSSVLKVQLSTSNSSVQSSHVLVDFIVDLVLGVGISSG